MQLLYLSAVTKIPNEAGVATIEKAVKRNKGINGKDEELDIEWYRENNLRPPDHLLEDSAPEISKDGKIFLTEDQLDFEFLDFVLPVKHFFHAKDTLDFGCIVRDTLGRKHHVAQMAEEIYDYIYFINRPWHEKITDYLRYKWHTIFHKKKIKKI